jgi:hypothetical protein
MTYNDIIINESLVKKNNKRKSLFGKERYREYVKKCIKKRIVPLSYESWAEKEAVKLGATVGGGIVGTTLLVNGINTAVHNKYDKKDDE